MAKYPIFLEMSGRRAVVIGAGAVAARKVQSLLAAGARVVVVGEKVDAITANVSQDANVELIKSKYSKNYLVGAALVIGATDNHQVNEQIYKDCQELEILCNVVDEPELSDFFVPAVVKRGDLHIAVSTEGTYPAYAGHIRKKLEQIFSDKHGEFLSELEAFRKGIIESVAAASDRKTILGQLADDESFEYFARNGAPAWRKRAEGVVKEYESCA